MPEYLSPAVYVEEVDTGTKPIEGVSTSTTGMVGVTERGPVNVPILVTSLSEYRRVFGGLLNRTFYAEPYNFLPHGVEGYFTNLGQRLYVVRVIDTDVAVKANTTLFDRGDETSANTVLLRAAASGSGTSGAPPLLYVLSGTGLDAGDWVRIGDGSSAEYRQLTAAPDGTRRHTALDFGLSYSHEAGASVAEYEITGDDSSFTLVGDTEQGETTIRVTGSAADVSALVAAATPPGQLLEIAVRGRAEYRYAMSAREVGTGGTEADLSLDTALMLPYADGDAVTIPAVNRLDSGTLDVEARAETSLVFPTDATNFDRPNLLFVAEGEVDTQEVRRIGDLSELALPDGAHEQYEAGAIVRGIGIDHAVRTDDPPRELKSGATAGATTIEVAEFSGLEESDVIRIEKTGLHHDDVVVQSIDTGAETIDFTPALENAYDATDPVTRLITCRLSADVTSGSSTIPVDTRVDLQQGDVLRIGEPPDDEYVLIDDLPNAASAPDAGNVVLAYGLSGDHGTDTVVYKDSQPTSVTRQPASLVLQAQEGGTALYVSDGNGYAEDDVVEMRSSGSVYYHRLSADAVSVSAAQIELQDPPLQRSHAQGGIIAERSQLLTAKAIDAGIWGNRVSVAVVDESEGLVERTVLQSANIVSNVEIRLDSFLGVEEGTILEFSNSDGTVVGPTVQVESVDRRTGLITLTSPGLLPEHTSAGDLNVRSCEFRLEVYLLRQPDPAVPSRNTTVLDSESFRNLSMDSRHSRYVGTIVGSVNGELRQWDRRPEGESVYIRVEDLGADPHAIRLGPEILVDLLSSGREVGARRALTDGYDSIGTLQDAHFVGQDANEPENRTGIQALRNHEEISLVAAPGQTGAVVQGELIDHCESERFRFAVLDGPLPPGDTLTDVRTQRQQFDTKYAALYYPSLLITDPYPANLTDVRDYSIPSSGHVLGIYARTDAERGVHKAPANEVVRGLTGLARTLNKREHDILNPSPVNINVIRDFRLNNRGIRVWGGRVITSDTSYKYVNVRRLLIFLEASVEKGLQWVVFEPNAEALWARVRRSITNFLTVVWRNGALEGTKVEEAFFVKCDRTTMTQTDIDNGRLICEVGVAPVKPAEFVIIRIGLWTAYSDTDTE